MLKGISPTAPHNIRFSRFVHFADGVAAASDVSLLRFVMCTAEWVAQIRHGLCRGLFFSHGTMVGWPEYVCAPLAVNTRH